MSKIIAQAPPQAFEIIRDRIGEILMDEITNQNSHGWINDAYWVSGKSQVWRERIQSFDKSEIPAVNVNYAKGDANAQIPGQSEWEHRYNIDVYNFARATDDENFMPDQDAMLRMQRLMGVCRFILEHSKYKTLGFEPPFIMNRHMEAMGIGNPDKQDALHETFGRLSFVVRVQEDSDLVFPPLIKGYDTTVRLELTDLGYRWTANNYA